PRQGRRAGGRWQDPHDGCRALRHHQCSEPQACARAARNRQGPRQDRAGGVPVVATAEIRCGVRHALAAGRRVSKPAIVVNAARPTGRSTARPFNVERNRARRVPMMPFIPLSPWITLSLRAAQVGFAAQNVIALRLLRLAAGGTRAYNEMARMSIEKTTAFAEAQ